MGFLTRRKEKPKYHRKSAKEREKDLDLRFIMDVKKDEPELYKEYMRKRLGFPTKEEKGEIGKFKETLGALQEVGAFKNPEDMGGGMFGGLMKDLMPIIALSVLGMMNPAAAKAMQENMGKLLPGQDQAQLTSGEQESRQEANIDQQQAEGRGGMFSPQSWFFIQMVKGKSPEQAASMIIGAQNDSSTAREIVEGFCGAKDNVQLQDFIKGTIQRHPEFKGFFEWAVKQPWNGQPAPAWFLECIQEIRLQVAAAQEERPANTGL